MARFPFFSRRLMTVALAVGCLSGSVVTETVLTRAHAAAAAPAADTPLTLKVLKVSGNQQISTDAIMAALPYHVGDTVTRNQLDAGIQQVMALYKDKNVGAKFGERERFVGKTIQLYVTIQEMAPNAAPAAAALVVDQINFVGNSKVPTPELQAATKLRPGSPISTEAVTADETAMQAVYKKHNIGSQIQPVATQPNHDNHVVLTYQITETAPKNND
ncbi:surface antigen protein [Neoasaia chiangmaiensis NBRC 101099]|uniref:Uncharacterized protein n=1 Tax=Neoasaia chiangmaiensis TaxID=320497 RepID=A0A1U9KNR2_9PROT|nr:POTRA domain-containing protein [Neoasaia chiangmaiensis]AQS87451.1 hypothetical protein A0U93_05285 [Neoasaia chiangmaiensis]GBR42680.1 surface antigen protein [Neoasaia chiangmaiensis NBRC 101099]GEN16229.1 hypothetical protein NCH01_26600 [Neoasaia chiangmaiensis]